MGAGTAVGFPVGFGVFVCQLVSSMVIGGDLHLLPAFVLFQFHTGAWRISHSNQRKRLVTGIVIPKPLLVTKQFFLSKCVKWVLKQVQVHLN